jgi:hypothetical protein
MTTATTKTRLLVLLASFALRTDGGANAWGSAETARSSRGGGALGPANNAPEGFDRLLGKPGTPNPSDSGRFLPAEPGTDRSPPHFPEGFFPEIELADPKGFVHDPLPENWPDGLVPATTGERREDNEGIPGRRERRVLAALLPMEEEEKAAPLTWSWWWTPSLRRQAQETTERILERDQAHFHPPDEKNTGKFRTYY